MHHLFTGPRPARSNILPPFASLISGYCGPILPPVFLTRNCDRAIDRVRRFRRTKGEIEGVQMLVMAEARINVCVWPPPSMGHDI